MMIEDYLVPTVPQTARALHSKCSKGTGQSQASSGNLIENKEMPKLARVRYKKSKKNVANSIAPIPALLLTSLPATNSAI